MLGSRGQAAAVWQSRSRSCAPVPLLIRGGSWPGPPATLPAPLPSLGACRSHRGLFKTKSFRRIFTKCILKPTATLWTSSQTSAQKRQIEEGIEELREEHGTINAILSLFIGRCGHRWIGASDGYFACPLCNDHDGDHHLVSSEAIAVQPDDWGMAWEKLCNLRRCGPVSE